MPSYLNLLKFLLQLLRIKKYKYIYREKDTLWQKTDRLAHQHKLHVTEKWMDNNIVTNCLGCNAEFSFTLRKVMPVGEVKSIPVLYFYVVYISGPS